MEKKKVKKEKFQQSSPSQQFSTVHDADGDSPLADSLAQTRRQRLTDGHRGSEETDKQTLI